MDSEAEEVDPNTEIVDQRIKQIIAKLKKDKLTNEKEAMKTSVEQFNTFQKKWKARSGKPVYIKTYEDEEKIQMEKEINFIRNFRACSGNNIFTPEEIQSRLSNVNMDLLGKMLNNQFFDSAVMNTMVCLSNTAYLASSSSLAPNERIKVWIRNLRRVGANSVSGFALMGDAGYGNPPNGVAKSPFIVKSLRDLTNRDELVHEVFLGLAATNHLRKIIPNFAYIYGFFECSPPLSAPSTKIDPSGKKVATFCNTFGQGNDTIAAVYENISPGTSFADFMKTGSPRNFMQYYIAALMAIHKAEELYSFTSYDFHSSNGLLRECEDIRFLEEKKINPNVEFYVGYPLKIGSSGYKQYYVSSPGGIPTVIDYGRSYVKVEGENYGMPDSVRYNKRGIFRNRSNPMHDAYKLLGFCLLKAKNAGNYALLGEIAPLFSYFTDSKDIMTELMDLYENTNFDFPIISTGLDLEDYIKFVIRYSDAMGYENVVVEDLPVGSLVLTPVSDRLEIAIMEEIGLSKEKLPLPSPRTVLEFYDVLTKRSKAYSFYQEKEDKEENKKAKLVTRKLKNSMVPIYRQIRNNFARDNLVEALDFEIKRLSDIVLDYSLATKNKVEAMKIADKFRNMENVADDINTGIVMMFFPSKIKSYFDEDMLTASKNYVGKFAVFIEMYQALMISARALDYMISGYKVVQKQSATYPEIISKITTLYTYIYNLIDNLEPTYDEYTANLESFIKMFNKDLKEDSVRVWYNSLLNWGEEDNEEYEWYFNTAPTLSSLHFSWEKLKRELTILK